MEDTDSLEDESRIRTLEPAENEVLAGQVRSLKDDVDSLKTEMIAQEHRALSVFRNLWEYGRSAEDRQRFKAAWRAGRRWLLFSPGRTTLLVGLSVGSITATLLAFQANRLLGEQNLKLDLQNHLIIVQSNLEEARRNFDLERDLLPGLITEVANEKKICSGRLQDSFDGVKKSCLKFFKDAFARAYCISDNEGLNKRLEAFSHVLRPYRVVEGDRALRQLYSQASGERVWVERLDAWLGGAKSADAVVREMPIPELSGSRVSPERGELMRLLVGEERIAEAFGARRRGIIFDAAYLPPGSSLMGVDLAHAWAREADLTSVDFKYALATGAHFERAVLKDADLKCATLTTSHFTDANLHSADLAWSILTEADMSRADLRYATLIDADLRGTKLTHAKMGEANLALANLEGADLRNAQGLNRSQIVQACLDSASTKLPHIAEFSFETYQHPTRCANLWGDR